MAEENVVVIEPKEDKNKKKIIIIIVAFLVLILILLLVLLIVVITKKKKAKPIKEDVSIEKIVKKINKKHIPKNELNLLVKKATILYRKGQKEKALQILSKISQFSKSLSFYNLGVIKIEEKDYKKALEFFQKAISNKENRAISSINAAYCALKLKNYKLFNYYRNLAYTFLPEISKNKNFPYYYALVMYYLGYEYEAIPALKTKTDFKEDSKTLLGVIYDNYNDPAKAKEYLNSNLYKGLNYAKVGEYAQARAYLSNTNSDIGKFALGLIDLKLSKFKEASGIFKNFRNKNIYPIKIFIKSSLFDIKESQKEFKNNFLSKVSDFYDLFFYFAPYKVYNINETINFLKKGVSAIPGGFIEESSTYLKKSITYSSLNLKISKAIKLAIQGHIFLSNREFKKLTDKNPNRYILQYDLALTYAQLGKYYKAYLHFLKAYHLNPYDLISGIFALYSAKKAHVKNSHLVALIKEDLNDNTILEDAMLSLYTNERIKMISFLQHKEKQKTFWILLRLVIKALYNKDFAYESLELKNMFEKDLIANLLYFYANNKDLPMSQLATNYQSFFFKTDKLNLNDFFYGAKIAKDWYFEFAKISGLMYRVRNILIKKAKTENFDVIPLFIRLAYANFYTKHFEEAYVIYNDLINNKNVEDPETLYFAAVNAIGAGHHSNAVALMELAKLKNPNYLEARYGLGLLWQEANNLNAASIQYSKIEDGFKSKYFDFNLKAP